MGRDLDWADVSTNRIKSSFPDIARGAKLNLGCGKDIRPASEGWVNLDGFVEDKDVVKHDILKAPWPFADSSFDYVLAAHVMEHIPPIVADHNGTQRDVLFLVMEEIHRVLKPGGILHIRVPVPGTGEYAGHPQHYRQWSLGWTDFFDPDYPENYYSAARFRLKAHARNKIGLRGEGRFLIRGTPLTEHLRVRVPILRNALTARNELEIVLEAVK